MDHASLIFASVFPVPSISHTTPTPIATPDLGYTAPGSSFGSPFAANASGGQHRAVMRNLAWSSATRFLSLPKDTSTGGLRLQRNKEVDEALTYLLVGEGKSEDRREEGLVEWYTNECRLNFANFVRPALEELWNKEIRLEKSWEVLDEAQRVLEQVQNLYLQPFNDHILPYLQQDASNATIRASSAQSLESSPADIANWKFKRDIHAAFAHCLPQQRFSKTLGYVLYDAGCRLFRIYVRQDGVQPSTTPENTKEFRRRMVSLLQGLERVGLGGDDAQKAFANAMHKLLDSYITSHYLKVDWYSKTSIVPHLKAWIKDGFTPLVELIMECLRCEPSSVQATELQQWQEMALSRLGRARVDSLFDFVINWDKSLGAILDVKEYLKVVGLPARAHIATSFSQQISRRLLHPGATTTYMLNVYISMIRAFQELDPKGALLNKVAQPVRRYLREREDTARIIISSLLIDTKDDTGNKFAPESELSHEIAGEMTKPNAFANLNQEADEELNWGDMNWQPLPQDATPTDLKKSKTQDVIYLLFTLWEREDFMNELKNILGDHLLRCQDPNYEKEIRLLELIKIRLGDEKLQACEVMLRDVLESKRINQTIRAASNASAALHTPENENRQPQTPEGLGPRTPRPRRGTPSGPSLLEPPTTPSLKPPEGPTLNAQILSSFFWPLLRDDDFHVPAPILALQKEYESRFERIKGMRKLRWMNALGTSTVTLDFEDRSWEFQNLTPWQVSVVYAFQPQRGEEFAVKKGRGKGITRNVQQLEEMLEMDEGLVEQSIAFWVGKAVLQEVGPDTYAVIERQTAATVDSDKAAAAQEIAEVQAQQSGAVRSQADLLNERKDVYMSFITGMLTNQGNMPIQRISMMMRMMVQGGFPFGADEVRGLLAGMEKEGKVVSLGGEVWGIKK